LETPLAGKEAGYTHGLFSFNAPEEFADAIKKAGICLVSTANNHCMDRGIEGMYCTLQILDKKNIGHTGTFLREKGRENAFYFTVGDYCVAVIAYTYGTNYYENRILLSDEEKDTINLLRPQDESCYVLKKQLKRPSILKRMWIKFLHFFALEQQYAIKKMLGQQYNYPREDNNLNEATANAYIQKMQKDIEKAKAQADFVFFCPHMGGQFNLNPGKISRYVCSKAVEAGCDAVIASHSHIVQQAEYRGNIPCFYSLGNFSMSPNSVYLLHENLPEYGIAVHLYLNKGDIEQVTFSVLKIVETKGKMLTVYPTDELYQKLSNEYQKKKLLREVRRIYKVVTGTEADSILIQREYRL